MTATAGTSNAGMINIVSFDGTVKAVPLVGDYVILKDSITNELVISTISSIIAASPGIVYKGVIDASTNPNYPAADSGDLYVISVAGKIGGASGPNVEVGDMIICKVDGSAAGTEAAVGANWNIVQGNIDGAVIGPTSATDNAIVLYDGVTGKLIKNSVVTIDGSGYTKLGSTAPGIKMKKLTGTTGATEGDVTLIAHGFADISKIIGSQVLVTASNSNRIPPVFTSVNEYEYDTFVDATNVAVRLTATNSNSIRNGAITVLITYEV